MSAIKIAYRLLSLKFKLEVWPHPSYELNGDDGGRLHLQEWYLIKFHRINNNRISIYIQVCISPDDALIVRNICIEILLLFPWCTSFVVDILPLYKFMSEKIGEYDGKA